MSLLTRLQSPASSFDWDLLRQVPSSPRRLAVLKLRELLSRILYSPIWNCTPPHLGNFVNDSIYWDVDKAAGVWERGLSEAFHELKWDVKIPNNTLPVRDAIKIV